MLMELITSILGGAFAGAGVVVLLSKMLIKNQLSKSLKEYQHQLDVKKDAISVDLAVHAENAKLKLMNFSQKKVSALEAIYEDFAKTSLSHHGFEVPHMFLEPIPDNEDENNSQYFKAFSDNFIAFQKAYQSISKAYATLDANAIYLSPDVEQNIATALTKIKECYDKWHTELLRAHQAAQNLFSNKVLNKASRSHNFRSFYEGLTNDWSIIANPVRSQLKSIIREQLCPDG